MSEFKTKTYGKWIFAGEHSVLRGGPALVFPLFRKKLELKYYSSSSPLEVQAAGENANDILDLFPGVLKKALGLLGKPDHKINGFISFINELPLGSGMGASSSLCVAFSRWFEFLELVQGSQVYEFARQLENIFHGESSGVDIAVVLHEKPLVFKRPNLIQVLEVKNSFKLYLSHTGQKGITKDCVALVNDFMISSPEEAKRVDQKMIDTTLRAIELFTSGSKDATSVQKLIPIMNAGYECFQEWGLTAGRVELHISELKALGALAVKPTGSGGGGYVLSLWPEKISDKYDFEMIPLFE